MLPLIFYEGIVEPPSEIYAIRALCLYVETDMLLEVYEHNKDIYYRWLKRTHLNDFIRDIVTVDENVYGFRVGEVQKSPCVKVDRIDWNNIHDKLKVIQGTTL